MRGTGHVQNPLWRWRSNPLRRREDVVEAWLVLAVWLLAVVGGTAAGVVAGRAADESFVRQRGERQSVAAVLTENVPGPSRSGGIAVDQRLADVRWTASDGSAHTGLTLVTAGLKAGTQVVVWHDARDRLVPRPPSATGGVAESVALGVFAAGALTGLVCAAGAAARCGLDRRRFESWDREWSLVGPKWGHRTG